MLSDEEIAEATDLCEQVCDRIGYEGKPLAAATGPLRCPMTPLIRLWQLLAVIREWRGDAHVAVLSAEPLTALEALVLEGDRSMPVALLKATRGWPDEKCDRALARCADRGLVTDDGVLTAAGNQLRDGIKHRTDRASMPMWATIGETDSTRLHDLLVPLRTAILDNGGYGKRRS